jgi:hypothetical protein
VLIQRLGEVFAQEEPGVEEPGPAGTRALPSAITSADANGLFEITTNWFVRLPAL